MAVVSALARPDIHLAQSPARAPYRVVGDRALLLLAVPCRWDGGRRSPLQPATSLPPG